MTLAMFLKVLGLVLMFLSGLGVLRNEPVGYWARAPYLLSFGLFCWFLADVIR